MSKLVLILSLCFSSFVFANENTANSLAKEWLNVLDVGEYGKSWEKADAYFKSQLSKEKWDNALQKLRSPLGKVISRTEKGNKKYTSLPGLKNGEYLVIQFLTEFQNKKSSVETLTLSKESGNWLPIGYFIQ